jgi:integrase
MAIRSYTENNKQFYEVYVHGADSKGKRHQRKRSGIESMAKAKHIEFELKRELAFLKEQKVPYRWSEWVAICLRRMRITSQNSTIISYQATLKKYVDPYWKDLDLSEINRDKIFKVAFESVDPKLSAGSRKNIVKFIKRILQMAVEEGCLDRNPCLGITVRIPETVQKVLTNTEAEKFLQEAKDLNHRFYPIWVVALMTGMRSGELYALKWSDMDMDARIISVTKQWTSKDGLGPTKTRLNRVVPINDELLSFLKEWKLKSDPSREFVLPHLHEWTHGDQAKVIRDFCVGIGVTEIKFHDLRATFITNLLARGESLARVMSIVGHSELKTTNGYLRKAGVDVQGGTDKLGYKLPNQSAAKVLSIVGRN